MRTGRRLPRFRRDEEAVRSIKLTQRDKEIIRHVARFRFLRSTHILRLVGGAPAQILRRLQALYHHGWLDRPRCQIDFFHRGGSKPIAYGLGSRGAALMRREHDVPFERMEWSGKKTRIGRLFLDHALMIAEILITVELACRSTSETVRFVPAADLEREMAASNRGRRASFHWSVAVGGRKIGLIPDGVFALEFQDAPAGKNRLICFLEADRGTMPITRSNPNLSCFSKKMQAYSALWKRGDFEKAFGSRRVAVYAVTTSAERVHNFASATAKLPYGRGLFACHTLEEVIRSPGMLLQKAASRDKGIVI